MSCPVLCYDASGTKSLWSPTTWAETKWVTVNATGNYPGPLLLSPPTGNTPVGRPRWTPCVPNRVVWLSPTGARSACQPHHFGCCHSSSQQSPSWVGPPARLSWGICWSIRAV